MTMQDNRCCDYGAPTKSTKLGYDCVIIPNNVQAGAFTPRSDAHCGNNGLKGETTCCKAS